MAHFHMKLKTPKGKPCQAKLAYISGTEKHESKSDVIEVQHFNIDFEPKEFWSAAEKSERKNCTTKFREYEMMMPRELTHIQHQELMQDFINHPDVDLKNHPMSIGYHAGENGNQPHVHMMFSERKNDNLKRENAADYFKRYNAKNPELGGCKKLSQKFRGVEKGVEIRAAFAEVQNDFFKKLGLDCRVSSLSLKDQNIDRPAEKSYGVKIGNMMKKGIDVSSSKVLQHNNSVRELIQKSEIIFKRKTLLKDNPSLQHKVVSDLKYIGSLKLEFASLKKPIKPKLFSKVGQFEKRKKLSNEFKPQLQKAEYKISNLEYEIKNAWFLKSVFLSVFKLPMAVNEYNSNVDQFNKVEAEHLQMMKKHNSKLVKNYKVDFADFKTKAVRLKDEIKSQELELTSTFDMSIGELKAECAPILQEQNQAQEAQAQVALEQKAQLEHQAKIESDNFYAEYEAANKSPDFEMN